MIQQQDLYAIVVWYNPTAEQSRNILSYQEAVRHVIVVDNSVQDNRALLSGVPEDMYTYISFGENRGIAAAQNRGCREAIRRGAQWMMTMDQDSVWQAEHLRHYIAQANAYPDLEQVGIFSPRQDYPDRIRRYPESYEHEIAVMSSGCLLSTAGYLATKGFREEFFIDEVDNEYCMHLHRLGMQVIMINNAPLLHELGELRKIRFLGLVPKEFIDHAPFRYYYMVRNILYLSSLYPEYRRFNAKRLSKILKRITLYDRRHKIEAIRMCLRGWRDYRRGVFGPMPQR